MAIELQKKLDEESMEDLTVPTIIIDLHSPQNTTSTLQDTASVERAMHENVKQDRDFFIVTRRGAPLPRIIALWQRQVSKSCPENILRIKFCGENGIDTGALSQEFFHMLFWTSGDQCSWMEHPLTACTMFKIKDLKHVVKLLRLH